MKITESGFRRKVLSGLKLSKGNEATKEIIDKHVIDWNAGRTELFTDGCYINQGFNSHPKRPYLIVGDDIFIRKNDTSKFDVRRTTYV